MIDNDIPTITYCTECETEVDGEPPNYCPECGGDEWTTDPKYDFERDVDLPFVFSYEHYNDTYGQWREFCAAAFDKYELHTEQIANCPALPRMKYCVVTTYWKLTEDLNLKGPFLEKREAREA